MKEDYLPIVRAVLKMSSALNEYDELENTKYHRFRLKGSLKKWSDTFTALSEDMVEAFVSESEGAYLDAYEQFNHFKDDLSIKNKDVTCLIILYCKLKSSINDLNNAPLGVGGILGLALHKTAYKVVEDIEKQYSQILRITDSEGQTIEVITNDYDELGEAMFTNTLEHEESE